MKKTLLFLIILINARTNSFGQNDLYQYFDGADTSVTNSILVNINTDSSAINIWQIGRPQKTLFDSAATLPNAIVTDTLNSYPASNRSSFTIKMVSSFFWGVLALQWKQKLDMDTTGDGAIIEFSMDHGQSWQNAFNNPYVYNFYGYQNSNLDTLATGEYAFSGTDSTWRDIWLCLDMSWVSSFPDTAEFRFTFVSDSIGSNKDGWMIDNMIKHMTIIHTAKGMKKTEYLNVFPNPSGNIIHIEAEKLEDFHIIEHMELVNAQGKIVQGWQNLPTKFWFDVSKFNDGNYTLKVKTNVNEAALPIVICKD